MSFCIRLPGIMTTILTVLLVAAVSADNGTDALWIEGEAYYAQAGSVELDRPPFGSRGACLGSHWAGRKGDLAVYRFRLERPIAEAVVYLRYARRLEPDSFFDVFCDTKQVAQRLALASSGGWGHLQNEEWQYESIPLGPLEAGWHELKMVSLADENNTNVDGFFLAPADFRPPGTRGEIEAFPQPLLRRAADAPGPDWIDESISLDDFTASVDDWYYPREEPAERAALSMPKLIAITRDGASLSAGEGVTGQRVTVGDEFQGWRLAQTLHEPEPIAILERELDRWGLIVYLGRQGVVAEVRKAVGRLEAIRQPYVRFPADYFEQLLASNEDVLARKVLASGDDPSYENVAGYLAPLAAYTFLGSPESAKKYVVQPDGAIGTLPNRWGADKALETVLFDPNEVLPQWNPATDPRTVKQGVLGGYLPAVNYGFWNAEDRFGWELCALMDTGDSCATFIRARCTDGTTEFYQLEPFQRLDDGKPFFTALLRLKQSWERFFERGMQWQTCDRRAEDAVRATIARALSGYIDLHPRYGMGGYWGADDQHDGFPPTTLSLGACLMDWGFHEAAGERLGYYLDNFVRPDGTLTYYGPAVAEYAQLLDLAATYVRRSGDTAWLDARRPALDAIASHLLKLRGESRRSQSTDAASYGLLFGGAEADTRDQTDYYFSGSAWAWRGLREFGRLLAGLGDRRNDAELVRHGRQLIDASDALREDILRALARSVSNSGEDTFLPPIAGQTEPFRSMTQDILASYTNYRYWPETLSARCLPPKYEQMILDYRTSYGGELLAMTRFTGHLDDWPFWHQADGLVCHDRISQYLLGYFAHLAHHQTPGTFTAYEQVPIRGYGFRRESADYCVPAELTVPMMTRQMLAFEERDAEVLWLCRAVPRDWLRQELFFHGASTRWGEISLDLKPSDDLRRFAVRITIDSEEQPIVLLRLRHPERLRIAECQVTGGQCERIDRERELVHLRPEAATMVVDLRFPP